MRGLGPNLTSGELRTVAITIDAKLLTRWRRIVTVGAVTVTGAGTACAQAQTGPLLATGTPGESEYLRLLLLFAAVALAPALLAVITSFARIVIVLFFLRAGLGTQQIPPNYVIVGLAIFLTIFTMLPTLERIHTESVAPLLGGEIKLAEAGKLSEAPLREFMDGQGREDDLAMVREIAQVRAEVSRASVPMTVLIPSFVLGELRAAFMIGFIVYLPFVIIDLVVASTLASTGLITLPATAISLPFKLLLFVMVDGWKLLTESLLATF